MTEYQRKRASKWDVVADAHGDVPSNARQEDSLLSEAGNALKFQESIPDVNVLKCHIDQSSKNSSTQGGNALLFTDRYEEVLQKYEADDGNTRIFRECSQSSQITKQSDMEIDSGDDSMKPSLGAIDENQRMKQKNHAAGKESENLSTHFNKSQRNRRSMSPGVNLQRQRNKSISPTGGRNRSYRRSSRSRSKSQSRSWSRSRSRSWSRSRSRSRSWSGSRSQTRSRSRSRSWSRSWTRSRSPTYGSRRGSDRLIGRGRLVSKGLSERCRDFLSGRCKRGAQCRYLHDDRHKQLDKFYSRGTLRMGDSGRGRYSGLDIKDAISGGLDIKDAISGSTEERDYPRESQWHGKHYDGDHTKAELPRNNKSSERCIDFTKGRCHRGSMCRFIHHDAASEGIRQTEDESIEQTYNRRGADVSNQHWIEPPRVGDTPCKFFSEGRCHRGEGCRFSHQGIEYVDPDKKLNGDNFIEDGTNWGNQTEAICLTNPTQNMGVDGGAEGASVESIDMEISKEEPHQPTFRNLVEIKSENLSQEGSQGSLPSQEQNLAPIASVQQHQATTASPQLMSESTSIQRHSRNQNEVLALGRGSISVQASQNHNIASQPLQGQNFPPAIQQVCLPLVSKGQMQHLSYPQPPNQFIGVQTPSTSQNFNVGTKGQMVPPSPLNVQRLQRPLVGMQSQQYAQLLQNGQIQQNLNAFGQIPQQMPAPYTGQNLQNLNLSGHVQQTVALPPYIPLGQGQVNVTPITPNQPAVAPDQQNAILNGQIQHAVPSLGPHLQNQYVAPRQLSLDTQSRTPKEQSNQICTRHSSRSNTPAQLGTKESVPNGDSSAKSSQLSAVTSEQAVQISSLSASLAQFFGSGQSLPQLYASLKPHSAVGPGTSQPLPYPSSAGPAALAAMPVQPDQGSLSQQHQNTVSARVEPIKPDASNLCHVGLLNSDVQKDPRLVDSKTIRKRAAPLPLIGSNNGDLVQHVNLIDEQIEVIGDNELKEVDETDTGQSKKEQGAQSEDVDPEVKTDGESKKSKDAKGVRMFKCALVEFVKDMLKPHWKDGLLSKEAHKTIVKKVVDKVTGAIPAASVPQTPEKIDHYLSHSKAKLHKLLQAYMEKYA